MYKRCLKAIYLLRNSLSRCNILSQLINKLLIAFIFITSVLSVINAAIFNKII